MGSIQKNVLKWYYEMRKKQKVSILIIGIIIISGVILSNVYFAEEYDSSEVKVVYNIEFIDFNDLNYILIPTGNFGRNESQEIFIVLRSEENNISLYHKYINGTIVLPSSLTNRVID